MTTTAEPHTSILGSGPNPGSWVIPTGPHSSMVLDEPGRDEFLHSLNAESLNQPLYTQPCTHRYRDSPALCNVTTAQQYFIVAHDTGEIHQTFSEWACEAHLAGVIAELTHDVGEPVERLTVYVVRDD